MKLVHNDAWNSNKWVFFTGGLPQGKTPEEVEQKEICFLSSLPADTPMRVVTGKSDQPIDTTNTNFSADLSDQREDIVAIHLPRDVRFDDVLYEELILDYERLQKVLKRVSVSVPASV